MDAYLAQVRAGDGSRVKFRPRLATIGALRKACNSRRLHLARSSGLRLNGAMRGRVILVPLGLTAFGAYSVGRQSAPASNAPVAVTFSSSLLAKPVAFIGPTTQAPALVATPSSPTPSAKTDLPDPPVRSDSKRKVEVALTAAAIAAIIVHAIVMVQSSELQSGGAGLTSVPEKVAKAAGLNVPQVWR
jgi:hypothetical protein